MYSIWKTFVVALAMYLLPFSSSAQTAASDSTIRVDASRVVNRITPWMTGTCIEDVNHEIYGGLYAQLIFGESFEEPPTWPAAHRLDAYGGEWRVQDAALHVEADAGAKMVRAAPPMQDGSVECDVRFADRDGGNAGMILRVGEPRVGADAWTGYEISLSAHDNNVVLGRHRNDWHLLRAVPVPVEPGQWHHLRVELNGPTLRIFVNHAPQPNIEYTDDANALLSGLTGLRTWNSRAAYRNLHIRTPQSDVTDALNTEASGASAPRVSGMWDAFQTGSPVARYAWDSERPYNTAHAQRLEHGGGTGTVGVANRGLNRWGIALQSGQRYAGRLYLRQKGVCGARHGRAAERGRHTDIRAAASSPHRQ